MEINNKITFGFFLILTLPIVAISPWLFPPDWGKTILLRIIISVVLFLFIFQLLYKRNEISLPNINLPAQIGKTRSFWLLVALFVVFLLASIFSQDPLFSFWGSPYRSGGFIDFASYIIFAILLFLTLKSSSWPKIWNFSIFIGILVALVAILQVYGLFGNILVSFDGRPPSTVGGPIFLGIYLLLLFFPTLSLAIKQTELTNKLFYYSAVLLFLYVILITGSRAAWIGLVAGGLYFFLFYPKKLPVLKIITIVILLLGIYGVYYVNTQLVQSEFPKVLTENKLFQAIVSRLSINSVVIDPRFSAWQVAIQAIKEKPLLGWGPENFSIGFDKYYNPALPYISKTWGGWWDRAHNVLLEIGVTAGIPALIIYLALFVSLFWGLQKIKRKESYTPAHSIQTALIAYLSANFFSFDTRSSYIVFFMLVGYSLHLINLNNINENPLSPVKISAKILKYKKTIITILFILLLLFLWQYNIKPVQINIHINMADDLAEAGKCGQAFAELDKILPKHSFLDSYIGLIYVKTIKKCAETNPVKDLEYAKKGVEVLKKIVKIRPLYTRSWIFLGSFTTIIANLEKDPKIKENLLKEAGSYLEQAAKLAPNHQEILIEQAKIDMMTKNYQAMKEKSERCIALDPNLRDCYLTKALSEIYLRDFKNAKEDIKTSSISSISFFQQLEQIAGAYAAVENYEELSLVYKKLIELKPNIAQYHSSLAFTYSKMGEYKKAREEAMIFLQLMPEAKDEVDAFLKTFPW